MRLPHRYEALVSRDSLHLLLARSGSPLVLLDHMLLGDPDGSDGGSHFSQAGTADSRSRRLRELVLGLRGTVHETPLLELFVVAETRWADMAAGGGAGAGAEEGQPGIAERLRASAPITPKFVRSASRTVVLSRMWLRGFCDRLDRRLLRLAQCQWLADQPAAPEQPHQRAGVKRKRSALQESTAALAELAEPAGPSAGACPCAEGLRTLADVELCRRMVGLPCSRDSSLSDMPGFGGSGGSGVDEEAVASAVSAARLEAILSRIWTHSKMMSPTAGGVFGGWLAGQWLHAGRRRPQLDAAAQNIVARCATQRPLLAGSCELAAVAT